MTIAFTVNGQPYARKWRLKKFTPQNAEKLFIELVYSDTPMKEVFYGAGVNPGESSKFKDVFVNYFGFSQDAWEYKAQKGKSLGGFKSRRNSAATYIFNVENQHEYNIIDNSITGDTKTGHEEDLGEVGYSLYADVMDSPLHETGAVPGYMLNLDKENPEEIGYSMIKNFSEPARPGNYTCSLMPGENAMYDNKHGYLKAEEHKVLEGRNFSVSYIV